MSKYFYHGIVTFLPCESILEIVKSGAILSHRKVGYPYPGGFNQWDYISLCKKETDEKYSSLEDQSEAFTKYIQNQYCLIIDDSIPAFQPTLVHTSSFQTNEVVDKYYQSHPNEPITDMIDEWQVRDEIPLSKVVGLGIPVRTLQKGAAFNAYREKVKKLYRIATSFHWDIVDTSSFSFVEEYEREKEEKQKVSHVLLKDLRHRRHHE